ncbi:MAG: nucleotide sugar dehydrogenase [Candidatus Cloacimonetes bacterium]|nr:nucleotide sugar dehydrogenase [Candidatus Cloacimonadota bacterium]MBL7085883.1 nucleotide sugar dehydrogenase [Candidatus Cloacimonadota bacterium]
MSISIAPDGREFAFPTPEQNREEIKKLQKITEEQRKLGRKIVVVQGMGFVGSVMATVVADAEDKNGNPYYFVHGHDLVSRRSFWKIPVINNGESPIQAEDPEISKIFPRVVKEKKTLRATWNEFAYKLADVIVVDIQLDAIKPDFGRASTGYCNLSAFREGMRTIGRSISPECLVLIETTVPPGTCEKVVKPIIEKEFKKRGIDTTKNPPLIAHSYERVMPGRNYVSSIRNFCRTFSGIDKKSEELAREFLSIVLDIQNHPLYCLENTNASELAKVLENSYRATNIALMLEWAKMAEKIGVNLFEVIKSIKVRKGTHDNMLKPSLGVGGYCLTKDPVLANWSAEALFDLDEKLPMAIHSVNINDTMALHTVELIEEVFPNLTDKRVAILGVSYLGDVADTRHSPSKLLWEELMEKDAVISVHDPLVKIWPEVGNMRVKKDIKTVLSDTEIVIFAVGHKSYLDLEPEEVVPLCGKPPLIIDCSNFISDKKIIKYLKLGCEVKGVGKGHIERLKVKGKR